MATITIRNTLREQKVGKVTATIIWMALLLHLVPLSLEKAATGVEDGKVHDVNALMTLSNQDKNPKDNSNPSSMIHSNNNNNNNQQQSIPSVLHFTYVSPGIPRHDQPSFPKDVQANIQAWKDLHPTWQVKVWNNSAVHEEFPNLIPFLEQVQPMAWVSDLLRYLILQKHGGFYFDTDTMPLRAIDPIQQSNIKAWTVCDVPFAENVPARQASAPPSSLIMTPDACRRIANGIIAAVPNHPVFADMARESLRRTARAMKQNLKFSVWFSGPPLWTRKAKDHNVSIFPASTFYPCHYKNLSQCVPALVENNRNVYGMHMWETSWLPPRKSINDL